MAGHFAFDTPLNDPVEPRLIGALQGSHEHLLPIWRTWGSARLGQAIAPTLRCVSSGCPSGEPSHALARLAGIVLWEREHDLRVDLHARYL